MRRTKYRAVPTYVDGIRFDSKKEAARYVDLRLLERSGKITGLEIHKSYDLCVNGISIGKIKPDFVYIMDGHCVVEDVKSPATMTALFKWKARHFKIQYGKTIAIYM